MPSVVKPGAVHEYVRSEREHLDAHVSCLEKLDAVKASVFKARLSSLTYGGGMYGPGESLRKIQSDVSETLDKLAPAGMYFGIPNCCSNLAGFWPGEGKAPRQISTPDAIAMGNCVIA